MTCSLLKTSDDTIGANQMLDGQIGVIHEWQTNRCTEGNVVQRYGDILIRLGKWSGHGYSSICKCSGDCPARIRLLAPGSTIRIDSIETN